MTTPVLTFFNNKGGVGKTSLVYHLAWMFTALGKKIVAMDLDAQANLTASFLDEDTLEKIWGNDNPGIEAGTVYRCIQPLTRVGDLLEPVLQHHTGNRLHLLPGDLALARIEDQLASTWGETYGPEPYRAFRIQAAFWILAQKAATQVGADLILIDVGPNLGAINRSALIASDYLVIPLGADLFSLQGLRNLGPTLSEWRSEWHKRLDRWVSAEFPLPQGSMRPIGYVANQPTLRKDKPVAAYDKWLNRMPLEYRRSVLKSQEPISAPSTVADDPLCLATLKHYRSLVPLAQEKRKPIFMLTPADGAIGAHYQAVKDAYRDYQQLAEKILVEIAGYSLTTQKNLTH